MKVTEHTVSHLDKWNPPTVPNTATPQQANAVHDIYSRVFCSTGSHARADAAARLYMRDMGISLMVMPEAELEQIPASKTKGTLT